MHLDDYVRQVADQVTATAALADDHTRQVAETLASAIAPAVRLALLSALSATADEVTAALLDSPGSPTVTARMDGDDVRVEVVSGETETMQVPRADDGDATARISLRLSEALKGDIDVAAARDRVSVNTWLVRTATAALTRSGPAPASAGFVGRPGSNAARITGWING